MNNIYTAFLKSKGVQTDTRRLKPGEMFVALKGQHFDANELVEEALQKGASIVITSNPTFKDHPDCFYVNDTLLTLQQLANYHRKQFNIPIIGITGTNGKTTTKELVAWVLNQKYRCLYTNSNLNNHIGVPLTLLQLTKDHEIAIIEMGANHPGDIAQLCQISEPNYGIITNIGRAHLEGFGSFENIIKTKTELYWSIQSVNGTVFVNADDELLISLSSPIKNKVYYSIASFNIKIISRFPLAFSWSFENESFDLTTHFFGSYNVPNFLAAIGVGLYFNITPEIINKALSEYTPNNMRSQILQTPSNTLVVDAYNANPTSMQKALKDFFEEKTKQKKALILGEMLELGEHSPTEHYILLKSIEQQSKQNQDLHRIILSGESFYQFKNDFPEFLFFKNAQEISSYLQQYPLENFFILLKGSRGNKLETLITLL